MAACAGDQGLQPVDDEIVEDDSPTPYVYEEEENTTDTVDVAVLAAGVEEALEVLASIDPLLFHETYEAALLESDGDCPYWYPYDYEYWSDTCTTSNGTKFYGYGSSENKDGYVSNNVTFSPYRYFSGDAKIVHNDGRVIEASGYSSFYETISATGDTSFYQSMSGRFRIEAPDTEGTWLSRDLSLALNYYAGYYPGYPGKQVLVNSAISGLEGEIFAASFDSVYLYEETLGNLCDLEPSGTISLRDTAGTWYDLEFQGASFWGSNVFPPDCEGCGQAYVQGKYLGEVCPDFSLLTDWDTRPW